MKEEFRTELAGFHTLRDVTIINGVEVVVTIEQCGKKKAARHGTPTRARREDGYSANFVAEGSLSGTSG
jgi:hypothetical protein